jgi:hypothetical protein
MCFGRTRKDVYDCKYQQFSWLCKFSANLYISLLWECNKSRRIWSLYNEVLDNCNLGECKIEKYEDIYCTENSYKALSTIKMKIIQEFIQIERPKNWTILRMHKLIINLRDLELYNGVNNNSINKTNKKWKYFLNLD